MIKKLPHWKLMRHPLVLTVDILAMLTPQNIVSNAPHPKCVSHRVSWSWMCLTWPFIIKFIYAILSINPRKL